MSPTMEVRVTVDKMADWLEKLLSAHLEEHSEPLTDYQRGVRDGIRTVIAQMRTNERDQQQRLAETEQETTEIVHLCPPQGSGLMPCCGRTPFQVPASHRMTLDQDKVTCQGLPKKPVNIYDVALPGNPQPGTVITAISQGQQKTWRVNPDGDLIEPTNEQETARP